MSITPRPCHSEPVTDVTGVGIRNLLAGNLRKSAGIMRFGNGLPRQSVPQGHLLRGADWLAMTGFFYPWDTVPRAQWAFLNTVSGAEMTTRVLSATDPVRNALPPTTECSPITVSPPRMDAPE